MSRDVNAQAHDNACAHVAVAVAVKAHAYEDDHAHDHDHDHVGAARFDVCGRIGDDAAMARWMLLVGMLVACKAAEKVDQATSGVGDRVDDLGDRAAAKAKAMVPDKVKQVGKAIDRGLDKLDSDEAAQHLASAKASVSGGGRADEDCSWLARTTVASAAVDELKTVCGLEVPLGRVTKAVSAAEQARAEQAGAPSLTECSSDEWAAVALKLDAAYGAEPRWTALKARWAKVCPDAR